MTLDTVETEESKQPHAFASFSCKRICLTGVEVDNHISNIYIVLMDSASFQYFAVFQQLHDPVFRGQT